MALLVLLFIIIPAISVDPPSNLTLADDTSKFTPDLEVREDRSGTRAGTLLTLKLKNSETLTIKSTEAYRNVTIRDYATLYDPDPGRRGERTNRR